ncbi:MAG: hypothetical protein B5766_03985 [Candidatus Lumbricidophila eiseniae]|uniref:Uncharacterized protein n=1 Tax=Candidatus Lumbricidiphila eiseniae TaxID=1969409 RepID=A0A2A6FSD3_9MICO|nr:MAG: hypothetical protein B5766_03985 [Candidatus Lumbricidophila eiseniae]
MSTSEPGQQSPADTGSAHPAGSVDGTLPSPLTGETAPVTDRAPLAKDLSAPGITHGHTWVDDDEDLGEYVPGQYSDEPDEGSSTAGRTGGVPTLAAPQVAPEVMPRVMPSLMPQLVPDATPQTVYVRAPEPPKPRSNRAFGILVAFVGTLVFAVILAGVFYGIYRLFLAGSVGIQRIPVMEYIARPDCWVPVVGFFLGSALTATIVNRGSWWFHAVLGILVAVIVYFAYVGGAMLAASAWTMNAGDVFFRDVWIDPRGFIAAILAREVPIWLSAWTASRGRKISARNQDALKAYEDDMRTLTSNHP